MYGYYIQKSRGTDAEHIRLLKVEKNPADPLPVMQLAQHYWSHSQQSLDDQTIRQLLRDPKIFPEAYLNIGDFYQQNGNWDEAVHAFEAGAIPSGQLGVNISQLTSGSDVTKTRFGNVAVTDFRTINAPLTATQASALSTNTENALNGATALQRCQMAAYLVTLYSFLGDHPAANSYHSDSVSRGIQDAIWTLLDAACRAVTGLS